MKFSDLDLDIPSLTSTSIRTGLVRGSVLTDKGEYQPHPAGVYFYKSVPAFEGVALIDYKTMEKNNYQKIDILNNTYLDNITMEEFIHYITLIENESINWNDLWLYSTPYQLAKYPNILQDFKVSSVMDVAIVLALIRPGSLVNYEKMKVYMHTDKLLQKKDDNVKKILSDTYGIPVFEEQFKQLGYDDGKYRYKKPHSIGYAYVLLIDFLKNS